MLNWDTNYYIIDNTCVHGLTWSNVNCIFTRPYFLNWHPLTSLSYAVEYEFFGDNAKAYHVDNIFLHVINSFLIFMLAKKIFSMKAMDGRLVFLGALFSACLFAVHPQHVESVVWIADRKGLLSTLFFLVSILFYINYALFGFKRKLYVLAFCSFIMSLLSKPMAVTMPVLLILVDIYPLNRIDFKQPKKFILIGFYKLFREKWVFFCASFFMAILTIYAQSSGGAVATLEQITLFDRLLNAMFGIFLYIKLWVAPIGLSPFYTHPLFIINGDVLSIALLVVLFSLLMIVLMVYFFKGKVSGLIIFLLVVVSLLPVLGIIQVGSQAAADRYTYLPLIPLYLLAGYFFSICFLRSRFISVSVSLVVFFMFLMITKTQVKVWESEVSLWSYVNSDWILSDSEIPSKGLNAHKVVWLAQAYYDEGDYENALKYYLIAEDLAHFPNLWQYIRFATSYEHMGEDGFALQVYNFLLEHPDCCEGDMKKVVDRRILLIKSKKQ
jgi:hypothetical protein